MDRTRLQRPPVSLISPVGNKLVDLLVSPERARELKSESHDFPSLDLTARELVDLESLATGAFSPLISFLGRSDYEAVCVNQRLADGQLWPLPIMLEAPEKFALSLGIGTRVALRDIEGTMIAVLTVREIFERDRAREAELLYGAPKGSHPDAGYLVMRQGYLSLTGKLEVIELPVHHDFTALRRTPALARQQLGPEGRALAYFPHHLMHRAHTEFARRAAMSRAATLAVFAPVGGRHVEESTHYPRVRALTMALENYPAGSATLNVLPQSQRQAGARTALLNAIVARNFGCSSIIVEHDCRDLGDGAAAEPCYGHYGTIETLEQHAEELGMEIIPFRSLVQEEDRPEYLFHARGAHTPELEHAREAARRFSYPRVLHEYQKAIRSAPEHGFTVFFTGLSGAGKSTIARIVHSRLMERGDRHLTMLDGDEVRKHLSSELGFSPEHRNINILRLGYVASLVTQHRGITICAPIAPYAATRAQVRAMVESHGAFVEVYVATSLATCEARDRKGLYARARKGLIPQFTGISDPYEAPTNAEIVIDTDQVSAADAAELIIGHLVRAGLLSALPPDEAARRGVTTSATPPPWADVAAMGDVGETLKR